MDRSEDCLQHAVGLPRNEIYMGYCI